MEDRAERPTASVVIPAHDEESVVLRCLFSLLQGARPGEFDVVVAANGCSDATAAVVRASGLPVRCLDLPEPGKVGALNAADATTDVFPRIYLDADVVLTTTAARDLVSHLADEVAPAAASPRMRVDASLSSPLVRAYYRVWTRLEVFADGYVGSGVYAVNAAGHRRVSPFPAVTNDDDYVRRSFASSERSTTPGGFTVFPARTVRSLVRRAARVRAGTRQLDAAGAGGAGQRESAHRSGAAGARHLVRHPRNWPDLVVFCAVTAAVRVAAVLRVRRGGDDWGQDASSRTAG